MTFTKEYQLMWSGQDNRGSKVDHLHQFVASVLSCGSLHTCGVLTNSYFIGSYLDFEPLGVLCLVTSARSKGKTSKYIFVERSGVARSVQNRKLIA